MSTSNKQFRNSIMDIQFPEGDVAITPAWIAFGLRALAKMAQTGKWDFPRLWNGIVTLVTTAINMDCVTEDAVQAVYARVREIFPEPTPDGFVLLASAFADLVEGMEVEIRVVTRDAFKSVVANGGDGIARLVVDNAEDDAFLSTIPDVLHADDDDGIDLSDLFAIRGEEGGDDADEELSDATHADTVEVAVASSASCLRLGAELMPKGIISSKELADTAYEFAEMAVRAKVVKFDDFEQLVRATIKEAPTPANVVRFAHNVAELLERSGAEYVSRAA